MINHIGKILKYDQIACTVEKLRKSGAASLTQQTQKAIVTSKL